MDQNRKTNTHALFDTNDHEHLDGVIQWATKKEYPDSSLNLVGCRDGRWFVEVEFGSAFDAIKGLSKPHIRPYEEPKFFTDDDAARAFAFEAIKQIHPEVADLNLDDYYDED